MRPRFNPTTNTPRRCAVQMNSIADIDTYDEALRSFSWSRIWELFDGDREYMNITHECIDRHRALGTAISVKFSDGHSERYSFAELSDQTGQFANWIKRLGVAEGDRVAVVVDPSRAFYVGMFGTMKRGAVAVPLFTLFGPEGLALRINDCNPKLILTQSDPAPLAKHFPNARVIAVDEAFWKEIAAESPVFEAKTRTTGPAYL
ncbi:MAG: hypothetical protein EPO08_11255, partial [Rhodospirillaceae bacterium]